MGQEDKQKDNLLSDIKKAVAWILWVDKQAREKYPVLYWTSVAAKPVAIAYSVFKNATKNHTVAYELYRSNDIIETYSNGGSSGKILTFRKIVEGAKPVATVCLVENYFNFETVRDTAEKNASSQFGEPLKLMRA
jgi:hypothetical protein